MELNVLNFSFERLGVIDAYESLEFDLNYKKHSELVLVVGVTPENIRYFIDNSDDIILMKEDDLERGYIVDIVKFSDESKKIIEVYCKSLSYLLSRRIIERQQTYSGTVEDAIRFFVEKNAINPVNPRRKIPNLVLGEKKGFITETNEAFSNKPLDEALWEICAKFDISYEIKMDIQNKQFIFQVWQGTDRSAEQKERDPVIFSKEFENVLSRTFVDDKSNFKNVCVIAGEGEGESRTYLVVNDELYGLNRREMFVDARDLQSSVDEENIPQEQYESMLTERAKNKLAENERVRSFETKIDYNSQFIYGIDYFFGDRVTIRNDELGLVNHTRIVTVKEKYSKDGFDLSIEFGSNVPSFIDKLKKAVSN